MLGKNSFYNDEFLISNFNQIAITNVQLGHWSFDVSH